MPNECIPMIWKFGRKWTDQQCLNFLISFSYQIRFAWFLLNFFNRIESTCNQLGQKKCEKRKKSMWMWTINIFRRKFYFQNSNIRCDLHTSPACCTRPETISKHLSKFSGSFAIIIRYPGKTRLFFNRIMDLSWSEIYLHFTKLENFPWMSVSARLRNSVQIAFVLYYSLSVSFVLHTDNCVAVKTWNWF